MNHTMAHTNAVYLAMNRYRIERGLNIGEFARLIGAGYDITWNALNGRSIPRDCHREPFVRYYLAHEAEISAFMNAEPAEVAP